VDQRQPAAGPLPAQGPRDPRLAYPDDEPQRRAPESRGSRLGGTSGCSASP